MLEFPKIENLYNTEKLNTEPSEKINASLKDNKEAIENKEKKEELPHTIEAKFEINKDGLVDIKTEYGTLKDMPKNCLPDDFKNQKSGEIQIILTDHDTIAKKMLNQLLETQNKDE